MKYLNRYKHILVLLIYMIDSKLNTYLVLGYGAREHATVKSLLINTESQVYCIGNRINPAGIYSLINKRCVRHDIMDFNFIKEYCIRRII